MLKTFFKNSQNILNINNTASNDWPINWQLPFQDLASLVSSIYKSMNRYKYLFFTFRFIRLIIISLQFSFLLCLFFNIDNHFIVAHAYCEPIESVDSMANLEPKEETTQPLNSESEVKKDKKLSSYIGITLAVLVAAAGLYLYYGPGVAGLANIFNNGFDPDGKGGNANDLSAHPDNFMANINLPLDDNVYQVAAAIMNKTLPNIFLYPIHPALLAKTEFIIAMRAYRNKSDKSVEELVHPPKVADHFEVESILSPALSADVNVVMPEVMNVVEGLEETNFLFRILGPLFATAPYIGTIFASPEVFVTNYCQINATNIDNMLLLFNKLQEQGNLQFALGLLLDMCGDICYMSEKYPHLVNNQNWMAPNGEDILRIFHHILLCENEHEMLDHYKNFHAFFFGGG